MPKGTVPAAAKKGADRRPISQGPAARVIIPNRMKVARSRITPAKATLRARPATRSLPKGKPVNRPRTSLALALKNAPAAPRQARADNVSKASPRQASLQPGNKMAHRRQAPAKARPRNRANSNALNPLQTPTATMPTAKMIQRRSRKGTPRIR
jgi:hypothetical protein